MSWRGSGAPLDRASTLHANRSPTIPWPYSQEIRNALIDSPPQTLPRISDHQVVHRAASWTEALDRLLRGCQRTDRSVLGGQRTWGKSETGPGRGVSNSKSESNLVHRKPDMTHHPLVKPGWPRQPGLPSLYPPRRDVYTGIVVKLLVQVKGKSSNKILSVIPITAFLISDHIAMPGTLQTN
jgi:hypothetical protein